MSARPPIMCHDPRFDDDTLTELNCTLEDLRHAQWALDNIGLYETYNSLSDDAKAVFEQNCPREMIDKLADYRSAVDMMCLDFELAIQNRTEILENRSAI